MIIIKAVESKYKWVVALPLLIMILLFTLSSIPQEKMPVINFTCIDKIEHFIAFFTLSFSWALALKACKVSFKKALILAVILTLSYGITDEIHQEFFTDGRVYDFFDLVADFLGATTSSVFLYIRYKKVFD